MKKLLIICIVVMFGCTDSEDNASSNLRKGDEFLSQGEYEIAEYYYEKIPEESVLYKTASRRKLEISKMTSGSDTANKESDGVQIIRHSYKITAAKLPIHKVTIANRTRKKLNMVEIEFTYLDVAGREVRTTTANVLANIDKGDQREINDISPGVISEKFSWVRVSVVGKIFY